MGRGIPTVSGAVVDPGIIRRAVCDGAGRIANQTAEAEISAPASKAGTAYTASGRHNGTRGETSASATWFCPRRRNCATEMSAIRCWRSLLETHRHNRSYCRRDSRGQCAPVRRALENIGKCVGDVFAVECPPARQHLVENAAERPDVASLIDPFAASLLWGHVRRGPQNNPLLRHCRTRNGR